jgi:hypothetical protein
MTTTTAPSTPTLERPTALELVSNPAHLEAWTRALPEGGHIVYEGCGDCPYARLLAQHGYEARVYSCDICLVEGPEGKLYPMSGVPNQTATLIRAIDQVSNARAASLRLQRRLALGWNKLEDAYPEDRYITREELLDLLVEQTAVTTQSTTV